MQSVSKKFTTGCSQNTLIEPKVVLKDDLYNLELKISGRLDTDNATTLSIVGVDPEFLNNLSDFLKSCAVNWQAARDCDAIWLGDARPLEALTAD